MNRIIKLCLSFILAFTITSRVKAQHPLPCGNGSIDTAANNKARRFQLSNPNSVNTVNSLVRVYFHICANDDGTNHAITTAQLATEFTSLLAAYAADNICFLNAGTDTVNNTFLNTLFNADNDPSGTFFNPYQVPGCINCFYTKTINGNNTACNPPCGYGGIALGGIPGTFYLVGSSNIAKGSTVAHEMGHCLGLLHTFEPSNGNEDINGANGSTAADQVADTPADPYVFSGGGCYTLTTNQCTYAGNCADPNGATNYSPPYTNLMAYWWASATPTCYPNLAATNGQFTRVNNFLGSSAALINCSSPSSVVLYPTTVSSGYYMQSAIGTFITSGSVLFNGTAKATLGGGTVYLEPGFHALPSSGGIVAVKIKPCN